MIKVSKQEANYRKAPQGSPYVCTTCIFFNPTKDGLGTCDVVQGIVGRGHTSDLYEPNPELLEKLNAR